MLKHIAEHPELSHKIQARTHACTYARTHACTHPRTRTLIRMHARAHARTHARKHAHFETYAHRLRCTYLQTHNRHTCKHVATAQLSTLNTLFFHTGVCEKRFPKALHVNDSSTPSPSSSMLMVSRRGVMLPAKKGSLSARAQRHCHLSNIDERGEGLDTLRQHTIQKEPFFADTGIKKRCIFDAAGSVALCASL